MQKCLLSISGFSHYRYFRFSAVKSGRENHPDRKVHPNVMCEVKLHYTEACRTLFGRKRARTFLEFVPDITSTPPIVTRAPEGGADVLKRIRKEGVV